MPDSNDQNYRSRRKFIKQTAAGFAAGLSLKGGVVSAVVSDQQDDKIPFNFAALPVLANVGTDRIEVIVAPNDLATGKVEIGTVGKPDWTVYESKNGLYPTSDQVLRFQISGLSPGRSYYYRVRLHRIKYHNKWRHEQIDEIVSNCYYFQTLNHEADTASFVCWNDTHENQDTLERQISMLQQQSPDFLIWNGDVTNDIHRKDEIVGQFLKPAGRAYATSVPVMLTRGNHDVRGRDARYVRNYIAGPHGSDYYGFRQGPLACLMMDTGEDKPDDHPDYGGLVDFTSYRSEQAEWLAEATQQSWFISASFRIAFLHIPLIWEAEIPDHWPGVWGDGIRGWISEDAYIKWHKLLIKAGIQLVISGHTHQPAYFPPDENRPYGQLIGGGPQPENATNITGFADNSILRVSMTDLVGNMIEKVQFSK